MSKDAVDRFWKMMAADEGIRREFRASIQAAAVGFAASHGCEFTEEELASKLAGELSDDDLAQVAGGGNVPSPVLRELNIIQTAVHGQIGQPMGGLTNPDLKEGGKDFSPGGML